MGWILLLMLFLSGFAGLVYEIVWARILALSFGTTVGASAVVIAAYMAGLGLGSIYWGRRADRTRNWLTLFAWLELGTAAAGLVLLFIFRQIPIFYRLLNNSLKMTDSTALIVMFFVSFILICVPTFLMGGTLPVISKIFIKKQSGIGSGVGRLYAWNTMGGVGGVIIAGFVLIGSLGQIITQVHAIAINLILGLTCLIPLLQDRHTPVQDIAGKPDDPARERTEALRRFILLASGITGFAALALEVFWFRALAVFLANSTYTFSVVLATYLTGLFLGSLIYAKFLSRKSPVRVFAFVQVFISMYAVLEIFFINSLPELLYAFRGMIALPLFRIALPGFLLASVLLLVPAVMMGIGFPAVCAIYSRKIENIGEGLGKVYFVNTLGSVAGSLVAAFILLPALGVTRGIIAIGVLTALTGLTAAILSGTKQSAIAVLLTGMVCVLCGIASLRQQVILPPSLFRTARRWDRVLFYNETRDGTVIVSEDRLTNIRACYVNNSAVIGTTYDALKVVRMLGHLPFLYNPGAKQALVVGFGVGVTTSALAEHPLQKIDCVEICPGVMNAAKYFADVNNYAYKDPRVNFIAGDGRNHLLLSSAKYDIISCDPTHPTLGSGGLYTKEYFQLCKQHLKEDGVACQYLPLHKLTLLDFKILISTFAEVFPDVSVWLAHSHCILVGTKTEQALDFHSLEQAKADILSDPYLTATSLILENKAVRAFTAGAGINTDDLPVLEFFKPASLLRENWERNIAGMMDHRVDPNAVFQNIDDQERLSRYLEGQSHFIKGLICQNHADARGVIEEFRKALVVNPENEEIKMFLENELKRY